MKLQLDNSKWLPLIRKIGINLNSIFAIYAAKLLIT
jgi:hypothetical protein